MSIKQGITNAISQGGGGGSAVSQYQNEIYSINHFYSHNITNIGAYSAQTIYERTDAQNKLYKLELIVQSGGRAMLYTSDTDVYFFGFGNFSNPTREAEKWYKVNDPTLTPSSWTYTKCAVPTFDEHYDSTCVVNSTLFGLMVYIGNTSIKERIEVLNENLINKYQSVRFHLNWERPTTQNHELLIPFIGFNQGVYDVHLIVTEGQSSSGSYASFDTAMG